MAFNIAIDGPAGAGKSTIAKTLAKELGYVYVDTGAMYRAMAYYFIQQGIDKDDESAITEAVSGADVTIRYEAGAQQVLLNGENITGSLRTEQVGNMASATSIYPAVRTKLMSLQQKLAKTTDVIMDGRDIGTVVLPEAELKVFLTASAEARARRRLLELESKGVSSSFEEIMKDIEYRDVQDSSRASAPLKAAEDAVLVDTSELDFEQSLALLAELVVTRLAPEGAREE